MRLLPLVYALAIAIGFVACTPAPGPAPMPPDASDAAVRLSDAAPDASDPCVAACAAVAAVCGPQKSDCASVVRAATSARLERNAKTGQPLSCSDLAAVRSVADMQALGQGCQ